MATKNAITTERHDLGSLNRNLEDSDPELNLAIREELVRLQDQV